MYIPTHIRGQKEKCNIVNTKFPTSPSNLLNFHDINDAQDIISEEGK